MNDERDLNFDVDALFDHLMNDLDHDVDNELDWHFLLRSGDLQALEQAAGEFEPEFHVHLQEHVPVTDFDGKTSLGDPLLTIMRRGALTADEVKEISERVRSFADRRGLVYEGVSCYDPINEEEIFGWLPPDDAIWRLRQLTDCGIEDNSDLPWAFLVLAPDVDSTDRIIAGLKALGFSDHDRYDEPDEDGNFGLCLFVAGRNNEVELNDASTKISQIAEQHRGQLHGIQFYTREVMGEIFGEGDDDDLLF